MESSNRSPDTEKESIASGSGSNSSAKFIPGAGTVAGGAISAGTADVITAALGEAYIGVMELVFKGEMNIEDIGTKKGKEIMSQLFKSNLKASKAK